jgi:hypothetical protein
MIFTESFELAPKLDACEPVHEFVPSVVVRVGQSWQANAGNFRKALKASRPTDSTGLLVRAVGIEPLGGSLDYFREGVDF